MRRSVLKWCLALASSCRQLWCIVAQSLPYPEARELGFIPQYQSVIGRWPFPEEGPNFPGMPGEKAPISSKGILQRRMQEELLTSSITAAGRWRHRPCTEGLVGTPIASTVLFLSNTLNFFWKPSPLLSVWPQLQGEVCDLGPGRRDYEICLPTVIGSGMIMWFHESQ